MDGKGTHSDSCSCRNEILCTYDFVQIVTPCSGNPCHYSPEGIRRRNEGSSRYYSPGAPSPNPPLNKGDQSANPSDFNPPNGSQIGLEKKAIFPKICLKI